MKMVCISPSCNGAIYELDRCISCPECGEEMIKLSDEKYYEGMNSMNNLNKTQKELNNSYPDNEIVVEIKTPKVSIFIACDYNDQFASIIDTTCKMMYTLNMALNNESVSLNN